jgi:hypothetical protein
VKHAAIAFSSVAFPLILLLAGVVAARSVPTRKDIPAMGQNGSNKRGMTPLSLAVEKRYPRMCIRIPGAGKDEFTWRLNDGNVERHTMERLDSVIKARGRETADFGNPTAEQEN